MTAVTEMQSCRCNSLMLVGFGLSVMLAVIVIQCSTVVQLQMMKADVTSLKEQLQLQQQQQTRDGDVIRTPFFHVSTGTCCAVTMECLLRLVMGTSLLRSPASEKVLF